MNNRPLDVLFVNPDSSAKAYHGLADTYSAREPPTWALLLAQACRSNGFGVAILDCDAQRLKLQQAIQRIKVPNSRRGASPYTARIQTRVPQLHGDSE